MNPLFGNNPAFCSLSEEKQQFLQNFAGQKMAGNVNDLAGQLSSAAKDAKQQGIQFSELETNLLINVLKENMSPQEQARADRMIQLMNTFRPRKT
jgi:hypothetical protein